MREIEAVVGRDHQGQPAVVPRQLLDQNRVGQVIQAGATVLLGRERTQQPQLAELGDDLLGNELVPVPVAGVRANFLRRKLPHHVAQCDSILRQFKIHQYRSRLQSVRNQTVYMNIFK